MIRNLYFPHFETVETGVCIAQLAKGWTTEESVPDTWLD